MQISEVRVKLIPNPSDRLKAFCSVTLDGDFVIRDIKIIDGSSGIFVAMPSRKLADRCANCGCKNHLRARFCNECGKALGKDRAGRDRAGRTKLHADIAHPINSDCRRRLQKNIVSAYEQELERSKEPGYTPVAEDDHDDYDGDDFRDMIEDLKRDAAGRRGERATAQASTWEPTEAETEDETEADDAPDDDDSFGAAIFDDEQEDEEDLNKGHEVHAPQPSRQRPTKPVAQEPAPDQDDFGAGLV